LLKNSYTKTILGNRETSAKEKNKIKQNKTNKKYKTNKKHAKIKQRQKQTNTQEERLNRNRRRRKKRKHRKQQNILLTVKERESAYPIKKTTTNKQTSKKDADKPTKIIFYLTKIDQ